jgi:hypothetical protein
LIGAYKGRRGSHSPAQHGSAHPASTRDALPSPAAQTGVSCGATLLPTPHASSNVPNKHSLRDYTAVWYTHVCFSNSIYPSRRASRYMYPPSSQGTPATPAYRSTSGCVHPSPRLRAQSATRRLTEYMEVDFTRIHLALWWTLRYTARSIGRLPTLFRSQRLGAQVHPSLVAWRAFRPGRS